MCDYHTEKCMNFIQSICRWLLVFGRIKRNGYLCIRKNNETTDMKSYFKFLSRNKLYTAIEAFGLSIALAFVMILVSYAFMEYRVGTHQPDAKNLYVPGSGDYLGMTLGTAKEFFSSIPEIKEWTRFSDYYTDKGAVVDGQYFHVQARAIDSNFLDMMGMKCRGCATHQVLTDMHQALISESFANRAFGNANPIGQVVTCDTLQFKVVGIVDDFGREDLLEPTDIFVSMKLKEKDLDPMDQFGEVVTIAQLADNADPEKVNATLLNKYMGYWKKWWSRKKTTGSFLWGSSLVRWDKLYFSDITCPHVRHGSKTLVNVLLIVALVLLLSAIFNYINLTVAQIGNRAKEMATRRLLGESVLGVVLRYIKEAALFTAVCFLLGVLLAWAFTPLFNSILDTKISLFSSPVVWGCLLVAYLVISLLSGLFPAIVVARYNPIDVVKGTMRLRSKMWFSRIFIVAQSVISMSLVVMAITMMLQMRHLANIPLGYQTKDILCISTTFGFDNVDARNAALIAKLKSLPKVEEATAISNNPVNSFANGVHDEKGENIAFLRLSVLDSIAMKMMGFKVLERYSDPTPGKIWVSEEAKRTFGVSSKKPYFGYNEGKPEYEVCGVVKDFHCGDALDEFRLGNHNAIRVPSNHDVLWTILVKTCGDHAQALSAIQSACKQVAKEQLGVPTDMDTEYLDDTLADALKEKHNMMVLIITFMGISILISALGLFGMSVYYGNQQRRQIALRKVMGASVTDAAWQLSKRFLITSCVAVVIAIPLCVKLMQEYLIGFKYHIDFPWWTLVAGAIFTLLLALVSVFSYTLRTALENPIDSIKME